MKNVFFIFGSVILLLSGYPYSGFLVINEFNKSLTNAMQKFFRNRVYAHELLDEPLTFRRFSYLDRSLHNTLNIGEGKPVPSETIGIRQAFRHCLILLFTISERERFSLHKV